MVTTYNSYEIKTDMQNGTHTVNGKTFNSIFEAMTYVDELPKTKEVSATDLMRSMGVDVFEVK